MKLKEEKGVTLLVLTITIIVLLIITSITIGNLQNQLGKKKVNNLYSDIETINTKVSEYYLKNNSLPIFEENVYMNNSSQLKLLFKTNGGKGTLINVNDEGSYYIINLSKLENLTLNYGREYNNWDNNSTYEKYQDVYIINVITHQVYYPKGVKYSGKTYFTTTLPEEVEKVQGSEISDDELELTIIKSNKDYINNSDRVIIEASINLNIGSNFLKDTLEYSWNIIQDESTEYTKFELDTQNSATLMSKHLDNISEYYLNIKILDKNGEEHIIKNSVKLEEEWKQKEDGTITNSNETVILKIGDYVKYDPTDGGTLNNNEKCKYVAVPGTYISANAGQDGNMEFGTGYLTDQNFTLDNNTRWRVIGIENGKIMLISKDILSNVLYLRGQTGHQYGPEIINNISKIYGYGEGAEGARAITVEDVNKITGYKPEKTGNGYPYMRGEIQEFGNIVTYKLNTQNFLEYNGTNGVNGTYGSYIFRYYDSTLNVWKSLGTNESTKLTNSVYAYHPTTLTDNSTDPKVGINIDSPEYSTIFDFSGENDKYWFGSRYYTTSVGNVPFGVRCIYRQDRVGGQWLFFSDGATNSVPAGIRPVVYLKSNVKLRKDSNENCWVII